MSKVIDILKMVDELRPNAVSDLVKIQYLNEIEGEVFDIMTHYLPAEEIIKTNLEAREMLKAKTDTDADTNQTNGTVTVAEATVPENPTAVSDPLNMGTGDVEYVKPVYKLDPYDLATDKSAYVLLDDRFMGVYTSYIIAKIEFGENESAEYMNAAALHASEKDAWMAWMNRSYMHKQPERQRL